MHVASCEHLIIVSIGDLVRRMMRSQERLVMEASVTAKQIGNANLLLMGNLTESYPETNPVCACLVMKVKMANPMGYSCLSIWNKNNHIIVDHWLTR